MNEIVDNAGERKVVRQMPSYKAAMNKIYEDSYGRWRKAVFVTGIISAGIILNIGARPREDRMGEDNASNLMLNLTLNLLRLKV